VPPRGTPASAPWYRPARWDAGEGALWAALVTLAIGTAAVVAHLGRGTTFFFDEWDWVQTRRTGIVGPLLRPHNGHLLAVPVAIYRILFAIVGLRHYAVFRATAIGFELLCVLLVVILIRHEVPRVLVLVAAAALLLYGPGWQDLLWPLQIAYTACLAGGLAAIVFLRRSDRLGDALATLFLALCVASSGLGLPILAGAAAMLLVARQWRRLWVIAVPAVMYGIWYLHYGQSEVHLANLPKLPAYMSTTSGATVGGLLGLQTDYGRFFCGVLVTLLFVAIIRRRQVPPALVFGVVSATAMWAALGLARGQLDEPSSSRYLYPGAILVVLAAAMVPRRRVYPAVAAALAIVLPFTIWANSKVFRQGAAGLRDTSSIVRVELGALQVAGSHDDPGFRPDTARMPQVFAGPYLAAVRALGSPAATVPDIERSSEALKEDADAVLVAAYLSASHNPSTTPVCTTPGRALATIEPGSELVLDAGSGARVWLRRFADHFRGTPDATLAPGARLVVELPSDAVTAPWHVELAGGVVACAADGAGNVK
jgi:hypothetical protein